MGAAVAVFLKDLREFVDGWRPIVLALVLPPLLVLVLGQLRTQPTTFHVLLAASDPDDERMLATAAMLRESSQFEIEISEEFVPDPLSVLRERRLDLVCTFDDEVRAYSAMTDPFRVAVLARSVEQIRAAYAATGRWVTGKETSGRALAAFAQSLQPLLPSLTDDRAIIRAFKPVDGSNDAGLSRMFELSRAAAGQNLDPAGARVAALLAQQTQRAAASMAELSQPRRPNELISKELLDRAETELQQVQTTLLIALDLPQLARALQGERESGIDASVLPRAMRTVQVARAQMILATTLQEARPYLDPEFGRRARALKRRAETVAVSAVDDGTNVTEDEASIAREARALVAMALNGGALSMADGPTLLDTIDEAVSPPVLTLFHPLVLDRPRALLPEIVALVVCFLPFVLAAQSLLREKEGRTAEVLLCAPGVTPLSLFVGKIGVPAMVALMNFCLVVALLQPVHHLYVKPGLLDILAVIVPAVVASTLIGLAASASASTAAHATIVSAVYLLMITLFSGFLYPISSANPRLLALLSSVSPLSFVHPAMKAWMFGAPVPVLAPLLSLLLQCAAFGGVAAIAYRRWLRSI